MDRASLDLVRSDPVLARFRAMLDETYGDRIARIVLFGSRARGESRPESDYDLAVFLRDTPDLPAELDRLSDLGTNLLYECGAFVQAFPFAADALERRTPLMHQIRRDGVPL